MKFYFVIEVNFNDYIIEIGCSWGVCTAILAKTVGNAKQVIGIDISKEALETCENQSPDIRFQRLDILQEPLVF